VFAAAGGDIVGEAQSFRGFGTDHCSVVPGKFGDGLGEFLEPAIIREAAVVDAGIDEK
jgi:hypothetical protein